MRLFQKYLAFSVVLVALAASNGTVRAVSAASKTDGLFANPVVAKGDGFEIKHNELEDAFIDLKANSAARGQTIPESDRTMVESNLLARLVVTKVLVRRATDEDRTKARVTTDKLIADAKKQYPSEELFAQQLRSAGMSPEQFNARAFEQTLCETVMDRELKSTIVISDEAAKKFYDENPARFERPETVRAAHILFPTIDRVTQQPVAPAKKKEQEQLAKRIQERAQKGEDFAKLAKEFSDDPGSRDKGGEYPPFARGEMPPEFETAAFSLKTNQVSDVVETRFGFHIIKLLQKVPPEKVSLDKVMPDLKEGLARLEMQKLAPDYFEKVKKEANVEIFQDKVSAASSKSAK